MPLRRGSGMGKYEFLVDTYRTERLKSLSVWSQIPEARMHFRPEPPRERRWSTWCTSAPAKTRG